MQAIHTDTQRKILAAMVHGVGEASYRDIREYVTVSDRSIRKHVGRLEELGLVERLDARVQIVAFPSRELRALASHVVHCYYNQ